MGVELSKKPKDLSASEREERGYGEGVSTEDVCTYDVVCSRKAARIFDGQPPSPSCRNASTTDHGLSQRQNPRNDVSTADKLPST